MEKRTINGKEIQEIMKELKVPFDAHDKDFNGYPIIPYEVIRHRANEVLGLNYSDEVTISLTEVEGEHLVMVNTVITIIDDNGVVVAKRSHARTDTLTRYSRNNKNKDRAGKISFDNDDVSSIVSLSFKKAFTKFGLGDQFALEKAQNSMTHNAENHRGEKKDEQDKPMRAMLTLLSKTEESDGSISYVFQNSDGQHITFSVNDSSKVKNYDKLLKAPPSTQMTVYVKLPDKQLLGVS